MAITSLLQKPAKLLNIIALLSVLISALVLPSNALAGDLRLCIGARINRDIIRYITVLRFGEGLYYGHAWIRLYGNGEAKSFSLWPGGVKFGDELDQSFNNNMWKSREYCREVAPDVFKEATKYLEAYTQPYSWANNNCTHFAAHIWNRYVNDPPINLSWVVPSRLYIAIGLLGNMRKPRSRIRETD